MDTQELVHRRIKSTEEVPKPEKPDRTKYRFFSWKNLLHTVCKRRKLKRSPIRHFVIIVYLLYVRYTAELGVSLMSYPEAVIFNMFFIFTFFACLNQGSKLLFYLCSRIVFFVKCVCWVYKHLDRLEAKII